MSDTHVGSSQPASTEGNARPQSFSGRQPPGSKFSLPGYIVGTEQFSARELARLGGLITEHSSSLRRVGTVHDSALGSVDVASMTDDAELLTRAGGAP